MIPCCPSRSSRRYSSFPTGVPLSSSGTGARLVADPRLSFGTAIGSEENRSSQGDRLWRIDLLRFANNGLTLSYSFEYRIFKVSAAADTTKLWSLMMLLLIVKKGGIE